MEDEVTVGAAITLVGGGLLELVRRWVKTSVAAKAAAARADTEAKLAVAETMRQISETTRADTVRAIDALIAQAREAAHVIAAVDALRVALVEAVDARQRDDASLLAEVKDLERRVGDIERRVGEVAHAMSNYEEFKKHPFYRR